MGGSNRFYMELRLKAADDTYRNILARARVKRDKDGKALRLAGLLTGVEERNGNIQKGNNTQTYQAGRDEALAVFTDGLAHEINNPINGILNFAQLIVDENELESQNNKYALKIIEQSKRVAKIVRNLQGFSQGGGKKPTPSSLAEILLQSAKMAQSAAEKRGIDIKVSVSENLPDILCVAPRIKQVFLDILANSIYALGHDKSDAGKNIVIHTEAIIEKKGKRWIRTSITDNGPGIAKEILPKIFDPFFTTKSRSIASGMGLAAAYGTVKEQGGTIFAESENGIETRLYVDIPAVTGSKKSKGANGDPATEEI